MFLQWKWLPWLEGGNHWAESTEKCWLNASLVEFCVLPLHIRLHYNWSIISVVPNIAMCNQTQLSKHRMLNISAIGSDFIHQEIESVSYYLWIWPDPGLEFQIIMANGILFCLFCFLFVILAESTDPKDLTKRSFGCLAHDGRYYLADEAVPSTDKCTHCFCNAGCGVDCYKVHCYPVQCRNGQQAVQRPGDCCPQCPSWGWSVVS